MSHKLTVAIPTYNRKEYLNETLLSLKKQTYNNFEIYIFDNASDYDITIFISLFPDLNIKIFRNKNNTVNTANLQRIIDTKFESDYIIMLHDDDTLHPLYFEKVIAFLDSNPEVVWAGSNMNFITKEKFSKINNFENDISKNYFIKLNQKELVKKLMGGFNLSFPSIVYQTKILIGSVIKSSEFEKWADRPLLIDLAENHEVAITCDKFINYRIHEQKESLLRKPTDLKYLINLFNYYKIKSINRYSRDFKVDETTNSINTASQMSKTLKDFWGVLLVFKRSDLFNFKYIGVKGVYYFIKFIIIKIIK